MVVRFLPPSEDAEREVPEDRRELAEVLDLRARLPRIVAQNDLSDDSGAPVIEIPSLLRSAVRPIDAATRAVVAGPGSGNKSFHSASGGIQNLEDVSVGDETSPTGPERTANEDGVRLLARKALSSGELRRGLITLEHESDAIEMVIEDFIQGLYLDDLGLARVLTEKLRDNKRASRSQIRIRLRERLLPDQVIDEALGELDDEEEFELLRTVAQERAKRLVGLDRTTAERRLLGFLARRGWSGERASRIAREALDAGRSRGSVRFQ